jgi:hypothetical protein
VAVERNLKAAGLRLGGRRKQDKKSRKREKSESTHRFFVLLAGFDTERGERVAKEQGTGNRKDPDAQSWLYNLG